MSATELQGTTTTKLRKISEISSTATNIQFKTLMHLYTMESLAECFQRLDERKAPGVDRVSKEDYGRNLAENLKSLVKRMKTMSYRP